MNAAIVAEAGKPPVYGEFPDPTPAEGTHLITVAASALSHLTHSRASGKHYSASHRLPFVPGVDGVGFLADGRRVYFLVPEAPFGGMGEQTLVQVTRCVELPAGLDTIRAAALANPGMSSWAALKERAHLAPGETVLINGATGTSGRLAVRIAKHLGAGRVIATGRNAHTLASLSALGADATLSLAQDKETLGHGFQTHFREGVDVVLDYLWGESAEVLMDAAVKAASGEGPIRFVQVGSVSAPTISLPGAVLRSSALELMGSGFNSVPLPRLVKAVGEMLAAAESGGFEIAVKASPLAQIAEQWSDVDSAARVVFTTELPLRRGTRKLPSSVRLPG